MNIESSTILKTFSNNLKGRKHVRRLRATAEPHGAATLVVVTVAAYFAAHAAPVFLDIRLHGSISPQAVGRFP